MKSINDMKYTPDQIRSAKEWLLDCITNSHELEDFMDWLDNVPDETIVSKVDKMYDGGWKGFCLACAN